MESFNGTKNLELRLECDRQNHTFVTHQYTAYPLGISRTFHSDRANPHRAYLYITNTSPGLLANDELHISLQLEANTSLHLTDQAATKVHPMPIPGSKAIADYQIDIGEGANLEFVPEPLILFKDATFEQSTTIQCHSTGKLFWSEMIVPGRMARGECYQFNHYLSRLQVNSTTGERWFTDAMYLEGRFNVFKENALFTSLPILGNVIIILPQTNLELLSESLEGLDDVRVASSILPQGNGLLVRAMARGTHGLKKFLQYALEEYQVRLD